MDGFPIMGERVRVRPFLRPATTSSWAAESRFDLSANAAVCLPVYVRPQPEDISVDTRVRLYQQDGVMLADLFAGLSAVVPEDFYVGGRTPESRIVLERGLYGAKREFVGQLQYVASQHGLLMSSTEHVVYQDGTAWCHSPLGSPLGSPPGVWVPGVGSAAVSAASDHQGWRRH